VGGFGSLLGLRLQQGSLRGVRNDFLLDGHLKAHFPAEYMAALLTSVSDQKDKSAIYLNECRRMGIQVLPPDVNESIATYSAVGNDIRFGLAAIRNVGVGVVDSIRTTRDAKGSFSSFTTLLKRFPPQS